MYSLLDDFVVTLVFRVVASVDRAETPQLGEGCAVDFGMSQDPSFRNWPRAHLYRLDTSDRPENIFAPGIDPVGYRWWETSDYHYSAWEDVDCSRLKSYLWRTGLLSRVQGRDEDDFPLEPETRETIRYTTKAFGSRVQGEISEQSKIFAEVVRTFVAAGHLSIDDAFGLHLKCRIEVQDDRPWPHSELPGIQGESCIPAPAMHERIGFP